MKIKMSRFSIVLLGMLVTHAMAADLYISAGNGGGGSSPSGGGSAGQGGQGNITNAGGNGGSGWGLYCGGGGGGSAAYVSTSNLGATGTGNGNGGGGASGGGCGGSGSGGSFSYSALGELGTVTTANGSNGEGGGGLSTSRTNDGGAGGSVTVSGGNLTQYNNIYIASGFNGKAGSNGDCAGGAGGTTNVSFDSISNVDSLTLYKNDAALSFSASDFIIGGRTTSLSFQGGATASFTTITFGDNGRLQGAAGAYTYQNVAVAGSGSSVDSLSLASGMSLSFDLSKAVAGGTMLTVDSGSYASGVTVSLDNASRLKMNEGGSVTLIRNTSQSGLANLAQSTVAGYRDHVVYRSSISGNDYVLTAASAWNNGGEALGTGSFTVNRADGVVTISDNLGDRTGITYASGWDGTSFHKKGDGDLVLSGTVNYTGTSTVDASGSVTYQGAVQLSGNYENRGTVHFKQNASLSGVVTNYGTMTAENAVLSMASVSLLGGGEQQMAASQLLAKNGARITISETLTAMVYASDFDADTMSFDLTRHYATEGTGNITLLAGSTCEVTFDASFYSTLAGLDAAYGDTVTLLFADNREGLNMTWTGSALDYSALNLDALAEAGWVLMYDNYASDGSLTLRMVPEPATATLSLLGLSALLLRRRRRAA